MYQNNAEIYQYSPKHRRFLQNRWRHRDKSAKQDLGIRKAGNSMFMRGTLPEELISVAMSSPARLTRPAPVLLTPQQLQQPRNSLQSPEGEYTFNDERNIVWNENQIFVQGQGRHVMQSPLIPYAFDGTTKIVNTRDGRYSRNLQQKQQTGETEVKELKWPSRPATRCPSTPSMDDVTSKFKDCTLSSSPLVQITEETGSHVANAAAKKEPMKEGPAHGEAPKPAEACLKGPKPVFLFSAASTNLKQTITTKTDVASKPVVSSIVSLPFNHKQKDVEHAAPKGETTNGRTTFKRNSAASLKERMDALLKRAQNLPGSKNIEKESEGSTFSNPSPKPVYSRVRGPTIFHDKYKGFNSPMNMKRTRPPMSFRSPNVAIKKLPGGNDKVVEKLPSSSETTGKENIVTASLLQAFGK
eukprot:jgi/Bigna1/74101/fgenesh1_pg.27_\